MLPTLSTLTLTLNTAGEPLPESVIKKVVSSVRFLMYISS